MLWTWFQQHLHRAKCSWPGSSGSCSNHSTVPSSLNFNLHHSGCGMTKTVPLAKLWIHSNQKQLRNQACKTSLRCLWRYLIMNIAGGLRSCGWAHAHATHYRCSHDPTHEWMLLSTPGFRLYPFIDCSTFTVCTKWSALTNTELFHYRK